MMTDDEIKTAIEFLNVSWTQPSLPRKTAAMWGSQLTGFESVDVMRALGALMVRGKFRPSLAEIIAELVTDPDAETSREAFSSVWRAITRVGQHGQPDISGAAMTAVRHLGGWGSICVSWSNDRREWHLREFCAAYEQVADREQSRTLRALTTSTTKAIGSPK